MAKKLLVLALTLAMVFSFAACGGGSSSEGESADGTTVAYEDGFGENVMRIVYDHEVESADPACTTNDYILMQNCMDTLVITETNEAGENVTVPGLATDWEVSDDGLTYSLTLREGVKFHNGEEFTADDVLYTVDRMLDPDRNGMNSYWMDMLKGAQDVLDGKLDTIEGTGIIIKDDYHVDLILEKAYSPFLANLSAVPWSICNREAGDAADEAGGGVATSLYGSDPEYFCGTGPFILKEWVLNDHLYMESNPDYWQGPSELDGLLIRIVPDAQTVKMLFDAGQIDLFDLDMDKSQIPVYEADEHYSKNMVYKTVLGTGYLSINENIKPFDDVRVRKALSMAIDRQAIIDSLYYGAATPAKSFLCPGIPGYSDDFEEIEYNPEKAKELLKEAGYENGFEMEIVQTSDATKSDIEVNEAIQAYFEAIGVTVTINQVDVAAFYDMRATGELGMYRTMWIGDFNDPDNFLYSMFGGDSNKSRSWNYYDKETIQKVEDARYLPIGEERDAVYTELEKKIIGEDAAMIPLWHNQVVRVLQDRVKGFVPMWAGYNDNCYYGVSLK